MISVVVPAHNAAACLPACLAALQQQSCAPDEVIVVDDGSPDETAGVALSYGVQVIRQENRGPAAARNAGTAQARGELVLFTDADCEPAPDWVADMLRPFADPSVVGAKGVYRSRQREPMARLVQAEFEDKYARMRRRPDIDFIDTYSAAYRREALLQVGGFNEIFPPESAEDVELAFRLAEQGARLRFAPQAWVWHTHPTRLTHYLIRKARYGFWRALVYLLHPGKIGGDSHTDPTLKMQFALVALGALGVIGMVLDVRWLAVALVAGLGLVATTLPFAARTWPRDRLAALLALPVHSLRAVVQAGALAVGLAIHGPRFVTGAPRPRERKGPSPIQNR